MRDVCIVGVGIHKFGRFEDKPYTEIGLEAAIRALRDAHIPWKDIQVAFCARMYLPATTGVRILTQLGRTGISITDVEAACASGGAALRQAYLAIAAGACDNALVLGVGTETYGGLRNDCGTNSKSSSQEPQIQRL
jgi:acetyl-CoA C-acetyltransferase